jgi:hypothetical protein
MIYQGDLVWRTKFLRFFREANPVARKAAVTVRAPGVSMAPRSKTCAGHQTRSEKSGANGANTSMISAGRCGIRRPPSRV